jgi:IS5 family transposase
MQRQGRFSQVEYGAKKKQTRRDKFLAEMDQRDGPGCTLGEAGGASCPLYPKGECGRPPIGLGRMLRVYFVQQWYWLADEDNPLLRTILRRRGG